MIDTAERLQRYYREATRPRDHLLPAVVDVLARVALLWVLVVGFLGLAHWAAQAVTQPGAWLGLDSGLFRALNGLELGPITAVLLALLNEPGPNYFALILIILGYCWWRRRDRLPVAALAVAIALGLGLTATKEIHHAGGGGRERPFAQIVEARTPITDCGGVGLVTMRGADGPTASCDAPREAAAGALADVGTPGDVENAPATAEAVAEPGAAAAAPAADLVGLDWRTVWTGFATFPSGHIREVVALCVLLVVFWPAAWPYALAYVLVMAFSRVHLGAHYPSDMLMGAAVGAWAAGTTLLALGTVQRLLTYLHRVPPLGRAWDAVFLNRVEGRPDLDPAPARGLRAAAYLLAANVALVLVGYAVTNPAASQIHSVLQNADAWTFGLLTARFDPATAGVLFVILGPSGLLYLLLGGLALLWVGFRGRQHALPMIAVLAVGLLVAFEFRWLGEQLFPRPSPLLEAVEAPVPPGWREAWPVVRSFPNLHALLAAALAGMLACAWPRALAPAQALALGAALTAVYFGAAWLTDALAGYLLGNVAAALARQMVAQVVAPAEVDQSVPAAPAGARPGRALPWPGRPGLRPRR